MTLRKAIGAVLLAGVALSCNEVAGIQKPVDGTGDERAKFLGTWDAAKASFTITQCSNRTADSGGTQMSTLVLTATANDGVSVTDTGNLDCHLAATYRGDTVAALADEACDQFLTDGSGNMVTLHYTYTAPSTFTVDAAGTTAQAEFNATVVSSAGVTCHFRVASEFKKRPGS